MGSKKKLNIPVAVICVLLFLITPFLGVFAVFAARKIILIDCDENNQNAQGSIFTRKNLEEIFFEKEIDNAPKDSYPARNEMGSFGQDSGGFFKDVASAGGVHNVNSTNINQTVHARAIEDLKALLKAGIIERDEYNQRLRDLE